MLALLLAAQLFPAQARVPFPNAARIAIVSGKLVALANDGHGAIFERDSQGGFREARAFTTAHNASSVDVADLDGDGTPDLAIAAQGELLIFLRR